MREPLVQHQIIEYHPNEPFFVGNATEASSEDPYVKNSHWHEELEIAYVLQGHYRHFIDGEQVDAEPGRRFGRSC